MWGVPVCRHCGKQWPEGYSVCPEDGMQLSAVGTAGALALSNAAGAASEEELEIGSMAGEYQVEKKLGQGGMGAVYGARHPVIGKRAAIKVITREMSASPEAVDRFVREAQAVNQVGHPNIVDVFGFGRLPDGRSFFVMEWLQGESLRERMVRPLPLAEALDILAQVATALEAAHDAGVLHRDLKPDNVFLSVQRGGPAKVKLLDFGLAKLQGGSDGRMDRTRTGVVMGTPLYISPEQAKGAKVDFAADIYSLGAIAYEMCSGQVPFVADSAVEIMAKHISAPVVPLVQIAPHTPTEVDALVVSMLDKEPSQRPNIAQVRQQLAAIAAQVGSGSTTASPYAPAPVGAGPSTAPPHAPSPVATSTVPQSPAAASSTVVRGKSKRGIVIGVIAALAVAGGAAAVVLVGNKSAERDQTVAQTAGEPVKTEPANTEPAKTEPAKTEPANTEPANTEPAKTEPAKTEPAKPEPAKTEPAKPEPAKTEPAKTEPAKTEPAKTEPAKPPVTKPDPAKHGSPSATLARITIRLEGVTRGRILVDGRIVAAGVTEAIVELPPGDHRVRGESAMHQPAVEVVHVTAHDNETVRLTLKPRHSTTNVHDPFEDVH
jgi:serine/threonine-protein kinase